METTTNMPTCIPADGLSNGDKKVLGLLRDGRKGFQNDVTIFWTYPYRTRNMVGFEV